MAIFGLSRGHPEIAVDVCMHACHCAKMSPDGLWKALGSLLGCPWEPLGGLLGASEGLLGLLGCVLRASWGHLGSILVLPRRLDSSRIASDATWSRPGTVPGPSWGHLGAILGPFWSHLGAILGPF